MDIKDLRYVDKAKFFTKDKIQLISILLNKIQKVGNNYKILSVGCGTAEELAFLNNYGDVYAVDIEKEVLKFAKVCKEIKICDVCKLDYPDKFFDIAVAFDVLEHIEDDKKAVEQIYRVLSKNGVFVFTVPAFNFIFSSHDRFIGHKRRYDRKMLKNLLQRFDKLELFFYNYILFVPMILFRILRKKAKKSSDFSVLPKSILILQHFVSRLELFLLKLNFKFNIFGLTICGIAYK